MALGVAFDAAKPGDPRRVAGLSLLVGAFGGLYWLAFTVVVYFLWGALNAWWLMVEAVSGEP
jgi:hypothetical protein